MFTNLEFTNPEFLWLLLIIPVLMLWFFLVRKRDSADLSIPSTAGFQKASFWSKTKPVLYVLRLLALALLILALARPQWGDKKVNVTTEGINIILALDLSESMRALDFKRDNKII